MPETEQGMHEVSRRAKMSRLRELGHDPWGQRFDGREAIRDLRGRQDEIQFRRANSNETISVPIDLAADPFRQWLGTQGQGELSGPTVRTTGRIMLLRDTGKLIFLDLEDWTGRIQLFIGKTQVGAANWELAQQFDLGDIIGVEGELRRTRTGELTIFAASLHFLTKSLEPPPDKHHGLTDPEARQRMRYVDLLYGDGVRDRFLDRTKIVQSIRQTLTQLGYCEVEGPTLHAIAGGAAARPFATHHNALDTKLYMRIALELHLKRLLVGGIERVFELGRVYRNEGISPRHNPEFTMLEVYEAFGDYGTMMDLTERLIVDATKAIGKGYVLPWGDTQIDFTPPFARRTYDELFHEKTGIDPLDAKAVANLAKGEGIETVGRHPDVIKSDLFEARVEDELVGPIFVTDYPASVCPLTKRKAENPAIAERFELFVHGMELANAYSELNDPDLQEELFRTQLAGMSADDSMARMDHDFIRALRHGMPPAGGLGIGIDRLVMLLTNSQSIRDIILFPLLRPEIGT
ncbi:MAG: lysine--tRNA ligase [Planctomycetota bacterium]|nr:lysine--tRNA ligase [Planctomycetota bacterium]